MIGTLEFLKENQQLKLEGENHSFITTIESVKPNFFTVKGDHQIIEHLSVHIGAKMKGIFIHEDSIYSFETKVVRKEIAPPRLSLSWPKEVVEDKVKCYQRAGFTGVEGYLPFRYEPVKKGQDTIEFTKQGVATWIGGDELNMISIFEIPKGSLLALELQQPVSPVPFRFFGKVHKIKQHGSLYHIRLLFEAIREKDRDLILKYCLQKQAQLNRTGLLKPSES
jgi:hypothetical protein